MKLFLLALLALCGCSVHVAGNQATLDDHTRRLAILEQAATEAVVRDRELVNGHNAQASELEELKKRAAP